MNKKVLPLLLFVTPLLLANSPAPHAHTTPYENYSVSSISYTPSIDQVGVNVFSLQLDNTGEGYICFSMSYLEIDIDDEQVDFFSEYGYFGIAPGASLKLKGRCQTSETDLNKIHVRYVEAFETFQRIECSAKYSKYEIFENDSDNGDHKEIHYYFDIDYTMPDKDYYYSYIVEYTVNGVPYSNFTYSGSDTFDVVAFEEVSPTDIEITGLVAIQGRYKSGYSTGFLIVIAIVGLAILFALLTIAIVIIIVVTLGVAAKATTAAATAAIVTPITIDKENKEEQKLKDSKKDKDD